MFQVCVLETGKQEVNTPLGVLKSEFNWKNLWKEPFLSLQCALLSCMLQIRKKHNALYL